MAATAAASRGTAPRIKAPRSGLPANDPRVDRLDPIQGDRDIGQQGASTLTTAELRLLPLLPTHLHFREISERLYISYYTVKSQAASIYRKLGASSRSQAVQRLQEIGLLQG